MNYLYDFLYSAAVFFLFCKILFGRTMLSRIIRYISLWLMLLFAHGLCFENNWLPAQCVAKSLSEFKIKYLLTTCWAVPAILLHEWRGRWMGCGMDDVNEGEHEQYSSVSTFLKIKIWEISVQIIIIIICQLAEINQNVSHRWMRLPTKSFATHA